uniref:NADH-ubiquinone oxidoreductase chain 6 n=1 Tax=Spathoderma clenchi TaxID=1638910 RepID=A0A343YND3_9MOLL|nr:NADH dehydrogenase subunit 6 [Spathoderma clenchi]
MLIYISAAALAAAMSSAMFALQPLGFGLTILLMAAITALMMALLFSSWYGVITFLIYVGAILIMFCYMTIMSTNTSLAKHWKRLMNFLALMMLLSLPALGMGMNLNPQNASNSSSFSELFLSAWNLNMFVGLTTILLIALIVVATICFSNKLALRTNFLEQ